MREVLVVRDIHKRFGYGSTSSHVLRGVSFELYENEAISIVGANGVGKTVLLNTIFNLLDKDSGDVYLNLGEENFEKNLSKVGFQFQSQLFTQPIKLKDLIKEYYILYENRIDRNQLDEMLKVFGLNDLLNKKINVFSGGQKQRINLLFAMMTNPKLIVLDEFITGLDINSVKNILDYVSEHRKKTKASMIIISHQPDEIEKLSDRILVMNDGKIVEQTTPKDVILKHTSMSKFLMEVI